MAFCWTVVFVTVFLFSSKPITSDIVFDEEGWKQASAFLIEGYNPEVKPCEDFVQYACGKWLKEGGKEEVFQFAAGIRKFNREVKESINAIDIHDEKTPNYKKSVKVMYDTCQNSTVTDIKKSVKDLFHGMVEILGTPPILSQDKKAKETLLKENVWHLLGKVRRELPMSTVFFDIDVQKTKTPCGDGMKASLLLNPHMDIPEDITVDEILKDVHGLASVINVKLDEKEAKRQAQNIVKFQQAINDYINSTQDIVISLFIKTLKHAIDPEANEDVVQTIVTVEDLEHFNPNISWTQYFKGLFTKEQFAHWNQSKPSITLMDQHFFENVDDILAKFDTETVFNYIFWHSMKSVFVMLNDTNEAGEEDSEAKCAAMTTEIFKAATAKIYFDHHKIDPFELKHDLDILAKTVFSAFRFLIAGSDWLDAEEKLAVINKIDQISFYSGIPDWIRNDSEIDHRTIPMRPHVSAVENMITLLRANFDRELDYVIGLRDLYLEEEPELEVNAYYSAMSINFKLGILIPPFYSPKYPLAAKYGFIGYVIGHELVHGFGIDGIKEVPPNAKTWLKEETKKIYNKKMDCINKQYSSFCFKEQKKCVNGRTTIEENLADIDGLKIAYMAYKFARETVEEEPPLPGFVDITGDQLFFLFHGRCRCSTGGEVEAKLMKNDLGEPHPPDTTRMIIPFRNFPPFAKSFKCEVGSSYAPLHICNIWGSFKANNKAKK